MIQNMQIKKWFQKNKHLQERNIVKILNVEYAHIKMEDGGDLYIVEKGLPFIDNLMPENYYTDKKWFRANSISLSGTSSIYKVKTKTINGRYKDIVLKWNRMGEDVPGARQDQGLMNADFNSPFEEFYLVQELIDTIKASSVDINIQKPLAIYVPKEPAELWKTGRKKYKMQLKIKSHEEIVLDMFRSYAVIYEWIEGLDAVQASEQNLLEKKYLEVFTRDAEKKLKEQGFLVRDNKPHHIISNFDKNNYELLVTKNETVPYSLIDFELLEMTPERKETAKKDTRTDYLKRQESRFKIEIPKRFHPHLSHMNIFGIDYIYGHAESTKGRLWVVGHDPYLFDYFLPDRWEKMQRKHISVFNDMYYTVSKDNIHLAWKVSKVGMQPDMDPFIEKEKKILEHGYNSPFEEFALAVELGKVGVQTIYPRAIYMTESKTDISEMFLDNSRYETHKDIISPDKVPVLQKEYDYVLIWGYWNGPDEKLAVKDGDYYEGIDILRAYRDQIITKEQYFELLQIAKDKLSAVNIEDLNLRGNHILISFDSKGEIVKDSNGNTEIRICSFEFLKKLDN
ncbi:hypothetical protein ACFL58_01355 [Elusimicrobiota bacterium]